MDDYLGNFLICGCGTDIKISETGIQEKYMIGSTVKITLGFRALVKNIDDFEVITDILPIVLTKK